MKDATNPDHYKKHGSGIECIQITEHMNFCIGNAIKYLWRSGLKGSAVEDLKKAVWYINREIARLEPVESHTKVKPWTAPDYCDSETYTMHDAPWQAPDFGPCEHVWHKFVSTKTQRCADCGIEQPLSDNAGQVEHKRKSSI